MVTKFALTALVVAIIAVLSLGYGGYSTMNPHTMTITAQQYVTNTQIGTTTTTSVATVNRQVVRTVAANSNYTAVSGAAFQSNCGSGSFSYGCNWPYTYDACLGTGIGIGVTCDGYLEQGPSGCVILAVPTDTAAQPPYDHYALQNLPSSYPPIGSWVVVKGGLTLSGTAPLTSAYSQSNRTCPTNTISVTSIQQTNEP